MFVFVIVHDTRKIEISFILLLDQMKFCTVCMVLSCKKLQNHEI